MKKPNDNRLSIAELCAKYDNEDVHSEQVTRLALKLFDATHRWLCIPQAERPLLEAAARLHDVGFSVDSVHHVEISTEIVMGEGLRGYRDTELPLIAAIILFHSGKIQASAHHPLVVGSPDADRVKRLGAFLRIADGLDNGHVQNTSIVSVRRNGEAVRVTVASDLFPFNLVRADRKADLFRAVFPYDIQFLAAKPLAKKPPLVTPEMHRVEAARRLLSLHFKIFMANIDGAVVGASSRPLHDIRISLRRMRAVLRVFRKDFPKSYKALDVELKQLGRDLGPARDTDVWVDFLESGEVQKALATNRQWPRFLQYQKQLRNLRLATVRRCLRGPRFSALRVKMGALLRIDLPRLSRNKPDGAVCQLAATQLSRATRRALKLGHLRHSKSQKKLHKLRIELRKARYLGEFFSPALGEPIGKLTRRLHQAEQALGGIHDFDLGLERVAHEGPTPPRLLTQFLQQRRAENLKNLETAWLRLATPELQRSVKRSLAEAAK